MSRRITVAAIKPVGDTQTLPNQNQTYRKDAWVKRNKKGGQFMSVKKSEKKFKGVRREKKAS
jgi:hypothetical protein